MKKLLLLLAGLAFWLVLLEVVLRSCSPLPEFHHNLPIDPVLGFRMRPGLELDNIDEQGSFVYRLSPEGFRGPALPEVGAISDPREQRLLFLGDSFLNAWAVREENLMGVRAAAELSTPEQPVRSWSLCCDDWGTAQELRALRLYAARVRPDAVVLCLYPANDLVNNTPELAGQTTISPGDYLRPYLLEQDPPSGQLQPVFLNPTRAWLRHHWRTFAWCERELIAYGARSGTAWLVPFELPALGLTPRLLSGLAPQPHQELYQRPESFRSDAAGQAARARWEAAWKRTESLLLAMQREVRALGADFLVLVIPARVQVELDAASLALAIRSQFIAPGVLDTLLDLELPEKHLFEFAEQHELELISLLGPLRAERRAGRACYVADGHLNAQGHAQAARAVSHWRRGLSLSPDYRPAPGQVGLGPTLGAQVPCLPEAETLAPRLDFRLGPQEQFLGAGFLGWKPDWLQLGPGQMVGPFAEFLLPYAPGDLVVRGILPANAPRPATLAVFIPELAGQSLELVAPGPFELRLHLNPVDYRGYAPVQVTCSTNFLLEQDVRSFSLLLQSASFEAATAPSGQ